MRLDTGLRGQLKVKWLRSLKLLSEPAQTREETSKVHGSQVEWQGDSVFAAYAGQIGDYLAVRKDGAAPTGSV